MAQLEGGPKTGGLGVAGQRRSFEDEVLSWLDADSETRMQMTRTRGHDYSRKWYRRTLGLTSMLLLFVHLLYVITWLVVGKNFTYFHVINWIGVVIFFLGGYPIWVHKTSFQVQPGTHHSMTQFYFVSLLLYLVVGIISWFINLMSVEALVQDYCADQPDGQCPSGTSEGGIRTFVVFGLLAWIVYFMYFFGALARYAFLYLATIERHYYQNVELRKDLRMSLLVALLGRNLCLFARTLNFLCCESCSPKALKAKLDDDSEDSSSYTDDLMFGADIESGRRSRHANIDDSYDEQEEEEEEEAPASLSMPRRHRKHHSSAAATDHGSPNLYICCMLFCFLIAYVALVLCHTSNAEAMFGSLGCFVSMGFEAYL